MDAPNPTRAALRAARKARKLDAVDRGAWSACTFWQARKRRFCNIPRAPGSAFCGHHAPPPAAGTDADAAPALRVPCPHDATHSVFVHDLAAHVKKCSSGAQAAALAREPFFRRNVNAGACSRADAANCTRVSAREV